MTTAPSYGLLRDLPDLDFDQAVTKVTAALAEEGFGVLTEIDVRAKLMEKIDHDIGREYLILGACNPPLAKQAIEADPYIGLMLPCNVVVASKAGGGSEVFAIKPTEVMSVVPNAEMKPFAEGVEEKLQRALASLT